MSDWRLRAAAVCTLLAVSSVHADIIRWDTGEVIPGTEGITLGPTKGMLLMAGLMGVVRISRNLRCRQGRSVRPVR